jgi:hypothetical protein
VLTITIPGDELWDDEAEKFCYTDDIVLEFEHSLVSLSKWEAKYHKLFLSNKEMTDDEMFGYIQAMLVTPNVDSQVLYRLTEDDLNAINEYVNDPMTGTTISNMPEDKSGRTAERISSELIYFWMSQFQIDKECEYWHLNRLFTLIRVHHAKTQKPKKMSKQKRIQTMAELNAARKKQLGTSG